MAEDQDGQAGASGKVPVARAKRGVPRMTLETAEEFAKAVWAVARSGMTSEGVVAKHIGGEGAKASGGAWRRKVASVKYFGLIDTLPDSQLKLSDLGLRVVRESEPETVKEARKAAVLQVEPYKKILQTADGHELPASAGISGTFHYDYEMSQSDADKAATAFEESVRRAGLLDEQGVVRVSAVPGGAINSDEEDTPPPDDPKSKGKGAGYPEFEPKDEILDTKLEDEPRSRDRDKGSDHASWPKFDVPITSASGVSLRMKIDMSDWNADDVVKVLRAIGLSASNE